jgi:recombination protein RecA
MEELERAVHTIQVRFGAHALAPATAVPMVQPWPTGCVDLDRISGIGGLPKGRLSVLLGTGTCGKTSLALSLLAAATHGFAHAVVIDPGCCFDAWSLTAHRGDPEPLTVVRVSTAAAAGEAAVSLAKAGAGFLLCLLPARLVAQSEPWLSPLCAAAERSGAVVVAVSESAPAALAHASSFSLALERSAWIHDRGQLAGIRTRLRCLKNKVGTPGGEAVLEFRYAFGATLFPELPVRAVVTAAEPADEEPGWVASAAV